MVNNLDKSPGSRKPVVLNLRKCLGSLANVGWQGSCIQFSFGLNEAAGLGVWEFRNSEAWCGPVNEGSDNSEEVAVERKSQASVR